jgi:hypothetical protein
MKKYFTTLQLQHIIYSSKKKGLKTFSSVEEDSPFFLTVSQITSKKSYLINSLSIKSYSLKSISLMLHKREDSKHEARECDLLKKIVKII